MTDLAKLRELLEKATKDALKCNDSECSYNGQVCRSCTCYTEKQNHMLNARSLLIDEAPALLDEIEALQRANALMNIGMSVQAERVKVLEAALRTIQHSMKEALIAGNDKFREIRLSADIARQALGGAK